MAIFKCKMCGAALEIGDGQSVVSCDYCGTQQTIPKVDDEKKLNLFNRANNLRLKCEFDKASGIYESIIAEFPEEAEAFWGLVLCKYGIEYVNDKYGKKVPTCHRTLPVSIMKDEDFQQACEYADMGAKALYRQEAKAIDLIQKKILEIATTEESYDIFICYKETDDATGARTEDSSLAQDVYTAFTEKGYKVFYARNSLRRVAGTEYEPYIYAALSSAKVMIAIGTKYEYYDAVWVKNEWSRFIAMMVDNPTKVLIPCYKDMDGYDIPEEFSNMQALDIADMTFLNSLEASVKRVLPLVSKEVKTENVATSKTVGLNTTVDNLLKRAVMSIEDGDFTRADDFCEQVLNADPENARAYLAKLMIAFKVKTVDALCNYPSFEANANYQKVLRFGDEELKNEVLKVVNELNNKKLLEQKQAMYNRLVTLMRSATIEKDFIKLAEEFKRLDNYRDSEVFVQKCLELAEIARKDRLLMNGKAKMYGNSVQNWREALTIFDSIRGWKNVEELYWICLNKIEKINSGLFEENNVIEVHNVEATAVPEIKSQPLGAEDMLDERSKKLKVMYYIFSIVVLGYAALCVGVVQFANLPIVPALLSTIILLVIVFGFGVSYVFFPTRKYIHSNKKIKGRIRPEFVSIMCAVVGVAVCGLLSLLLYSNETTMHVSGCLIVLMFYNVFSMLFVLYKKKLLR